MRDWWEGDRQPKQPAAQQAQLAPLREMEGLLTGSDACPANIYLRGWTLGKDTCLDIMTTNTLQAATLERCAKDTTYAMDQALANKLRL